jgi:hypothetical protein
MRDVAADVVSLLTSKWPGSGALNFYPNGYVSSPNQPTLGGTFTITFWFYATQYPSGIDYNFIVVQGFGAPQIYFLLAGSTVASGNLRTQLYDGANAYAWFYQGTPPSLNTWHFVSWVVNRVTAYEYIYLDGQLIGSLSIPNLGSTNSGTNFLIAYPGSVSNTFSLADVRIYNRALTADEIQSLYNVDLANIPTNGLVGWWPLNDGSGLVARDWSGNGNDGSLVNNPIWTSDVWKLPSVKIAKGEDYQFQDVAAGDAILLYPISEERKYFDLAAKSLFVDTKLTARTLTGKSRNQLVALVKTATNILTRPYWWPSGYIYIMPANFQDFSVKRAKIFEIDYDISLWSTEDVSV